MRQRLNINKLAYNKHKIYCVSLFCKEKNSFLNNINTKSIAHNKRFWKTVKLHFSDKNRYKETITLIENNEILSDELYKVIQNFYKVVVSSEDIRIF